ncbi:hypothetical protein CONLIGDRAFT_667798 [Coniochaeta ligniaria NRRL 30616]|uniref:Uncharacterized protein n=1 Tax=Coniochaeta ligniaria NRRL 30616 TaxID=1408157 RepID=A0A1J7IW96_9PEZI|nr:hypothetical protein CONLIGDRAFT_667798 [Coniochaeta ligniaria NRRL 30616]
MTSAVMQRLLCLLAFAAGAYTNPVPTPPPVTSGTATSDVAGALDTPTCTTVLTSIVTGFQGDFTAKVAKTIYTKTVTEHEQVDCGGCALSITTELAKFWGGFGPQQIITATTTAKHASTTTLTVCSSNPTPPTHGQIPKDVDAPAASSSGECTFTKVIVPTPHLLGEGNKTVYTTTATTTSHIDCAGCNYLAVSTTDYLHPGPVVQYTATTTASTPTAETAYVCLKSPSVVLPPSSSQGTRPATTPTTPSSPPATPTPTAEVTIHKTITKTIYAGTATLVKTATCGPMHGPGPQTSHGAIPKREEDITSERNPRPKTETVYSTVVVSTSATWTRTSFHCVGMKPTLTATPIEGTPRGLGGRGTKTTTPPTHPTLPPGVTASTSTYNFPPRG